MALSKLLTRAGHRAQCLCLPEPALDLLGRPVWEVSVDEQLVEEVGGRALALGPGHGSDPPRSALEEEPEENPPDIDSGGTGLTR